MPADYSPHCIIPPHISDNFPLKVKCYQMSLRQFRLNGYLICAASDYRDTDYEFLNRLTFGE